MRTFRLAAALAAWRQHAAHAASAKQIVLMAIARLQNSMASKAWQSWRAYAVHNAELEQRLMPVLAARLKGQTWATLDFWADWAHRRALLRELLETAQLSRRQKLQRDSFAAWLHSVQRNTGALIMVSYSHSRYAQLIIPPLAGC